MDKNIKLKKMRREGVVGSRLSKIESKIDQILDLVSNGHTKSAAVVAQPDTQAIVMKAEESKDKQISLAVSGMHCVSCARIIEKKLQKVAGVKEANVNFTAEKARIIFDGSKVDTDDLIAAIVSAGYKATVPNTADPEEERK